MSTDDVYLKCIVSVALLSSTVAALASPLAITRSVDLTTDIGAVSTDAPFSCKLVWSVELLFLYDRINLKDLWANWLIVHWLTYLHVDLWH